MHDTFDAAWFTPVTAAVGTGIIGSTLHACANPAAIGEQYSPTRITRHGRTFNVDPHFKVVRLAHLGELLGRGSRYVLVVSLTSDAPAGLHDLFGNGWMEDGETAFAACMRAVHVHQCLDLSVLDDLRNLMQAIPVPNGPRRRRAYPAALGPAVLALGAYDTYLMACRLFPRTFDLAELRHAVARDGDPAALKGWLHRLPPDFAELAGLLGGHFPDAGNLGLAPAVIRVILDALRAWPPMPGSRRFGSRILQAIAEAREWQRLPVLAGRYASRHTLTDFLVQHWGRAWPAFDAAVAMATLVACYEAVLPDALWRAIIGGDDARFITAVLERFPPSELQQLRILAEAQYQRADAALTVLDPFGALRAQLAQRWQVETVPGATATSARRDPSPGRRAWVAAMEAGDLPRMRALEADGVDACAYHEVGLRLARRHGHVDVELHLLGALTRHGARAAPGIDGS